MSTPIEPTIPQTTALASVDELVTQAQRLGLIWTLRPGTVLDVLNGDAAYSPRVQLDGDDQNSRIMAASLVGGLAIGMRVMVMFVPPEGYYIIGVINVDTTKRYEIGARTSHGTTITTTETVMETFTSFTALAGAAYRYEVDGAILAATSTYTRFRLRKTNTAGQSLGMSDYWPGIGLGNAPFRHEGYFRNISNGAITTNIVLTANTSISTSNWVADAELPRYVSIQYAGPAVEYPSAVAIT